MSTLGSTLAHGHARRQIQNSADIFHRDLLHIKQQTGQRRLKRAALYRQIRSNIRDARGFHQLTWQEYGDQTGRRKDGKVIFLILAADGDGFVVYSLVLLASEPWNSSSMPYVRISRHAAARMLQTFNADTFPVLASLLGKSFWYGIIGEHYKVYGQKWNVPGDQSFALFTDAGAVIFTFNHNEEEIEFRTAIRYEAMTPALARKLRQRHEKASAEGRVHVAPWKTQEGESHE